MTNPFPNPFAQPTSATVTPAVPPAPSGAAPADDPFGAPAPAVSRAPRMIDLYNPQTGGRLLLLAPVKVEQITRNKIVNGVPTTQISTRMTTDLAVLDGGDLHYGGKPEDPRVNTPHTTVVQPPVLFEEVWIENVALVNAMRDALTARRTGNGSWMILGKLYLGEARNGNNAPWLIGRPDLAGERGAVHDPLPQWRAAAHAFLASPAAVPMLSRPRG